MRANYISIFKPKMFALIPEFCARYKLGIVLFDLQNNLLGSYETLVLGKKYLEQSMFFLKVGPLIRQRKLSFDVRCISHPRLQF